MHDAPPMRVSTHARRIWPVALDQKSNFTLKLLVHSFQVIFNVYLGLQTLSELREEQDGEDLSIPLLWHALERSIALRFVARAFVLVLLQFASRPLSVHLHHFPADSVRQASSLSRRRAKERCHLGP
jgi:hypothetical protein